MVDAEKQYHLACTFCHWNSLALGLRDEKPNDLVVGAIKREREAPLEREMSRLVEAYQRIVRSEIKAQEAARRALRVRPFRSSLSVPSIARLAAESAETQPRVREPITVHQVEETLATKEADRREWARQERGSIATMQGPSIDEGGNAVGAGPSSGALAEDSEPIELPPAPQDVAYDSTVPYAEVTSLRQRLNLIATQPRLLAYVFFFFFFFCYNVCMVCIPPLYWWTSFRLPRHN